MIELPKELVIDSVDKLIDNVYGSDLNEHPYYRAIAYFVPLTTDIRRAYGIIYYKKKGWG